MIIKLKHGFLDLGLKNKMIKIIFYTEDRKDITEKDKFVEIERGDLLPYEYQGIMISNSGVIESYTGKISND